MATLLGQLHGTNKNKLAVLKRLREILDVGNGTEYEAILAAGAAVADNVVPMLEAHAVKYLKPAAKVIYLTLRGERGLEEMSDETTHPILGGAALVAQALVKVLNQELTQGAQANAKLVRFAISALDELTRAHSSVHAVAEAGAIVPCVELCGSTCTATLEWLRSRWNVLQRVAQRNQPSQPEAQLEVQLEAPAANPVVVAAAASPAAATVAAAHATAKRRRKRGRAAAGALEERVVGARSVCTAAVDKRARELALPAFDEYMADRIDAAELDKRKAEAYAKATAEHA